MAYLSFWSSLVWRLQDLIFLPQIQPCLALMFLYSTVSYVVLTTFFDKDKMTGWFEFCIKLAYCSSFRFLFLKVIFKSFFNNTSISVDFLRSQSTTSQFVRGRFFYLVIFCICFSSYLVSFCQFFTVQLAYFIHVSNSSLINTCLKW